MLLAPIPNPSFPRKRESRASHTYTATSLRIGISWNHWCWFDQTCTCAGELDLMSFIARMLLVSTSLSPLFLVVGVQQFEHGASWIGWSSWILVAILLVGMCGGLLKYMSRKSQHHLFLIEGFERRDQEMLTYLFIYLLPFIRSAGPVTLKWVANQQFRTSGHHLGDCTNRSFPLQSSNAPRFRLSLLFCKKQSRSFLSSHQ